MKVLALLHKNKLVFHSNKECTVDRAASFTGSAKWPNWLCADDGYRLTALGYDYLALKTLVQRSGFTFCFCL